ncbi:hypothetical protein TWF696_007830 [Orbilia brochopaga]|uniref:Uncharacterized protein n=1 Tax=Orbilia brochopaga TaxID=3140254 RepID=A0AAV9UQ22_9PEZI
MRDGFKSTVGSAFASGSQVQASQLGGQYGQVCLLAFCGTASQGQLALIDPSTGGISSSCFPAAGLSLLSGLVPLVYYMFASLVRVDYTGPSAALAPDSLPALDHGLGSLACSCDERRGSLEGGGRREEGTGTVGNFP